MSVLRLLFTTIKRVPSALSSHSSHGFHDADSITNKLDLSLTLPQTVFVSEDIVQVNILATSGDMSILANHVPSIEPLCPGIMEIIESGNISTKWFLSGGFANIHPGNKLTITNMGWGTPLDSFSLEATRANLQEALKVASGNGPVEQKLEAQIEAEVYEALQCALHSK